MAKSQNNRVAFIAESGAEKARPFFRAHLPAKGLRQLGYSTRVAEVMFEQEDGKLNTWTQGETQPPMPPHFIIMHTVLTPSLNKMGVPEMNWTSSKPLIEQARSKGQKILFDLDDDIWNIPEYNPEYNNKKGVKAHLEQWVDDINSSDGLIVSTDSIKDSASANGVNVPIFVCPNSINVYDYRGEHSDHSPLRIGWFGVLKYRLPDIRLWKDMLYEVLKNRWHEVEFWHFGADWDNSILEVFDRFPVQIVERPWVLPEYLHQAVKMVDIGIIPAFPNQFNEGRSNVMGLAYAAAGIPFVASATAEYEKLVAPSTTPDYTLKALIEYTWNRVEQGRYLQEAVQSFSPKNMAINYHAALRELI